jgi:hypothetical protein
MTDKTNDLQDILTKLQNSNTNAMDRKVYATTKKLAEAAEKDIDLNVAINSRITESNVSIQNYRIDIVLQEFAGRQKKFYNIVEATENKIIHQELSLFETAMGIVKKLMVGTFHGVDELEKLDMEYTNSLYEVWTHQSRAKRGINENIAIAKADAAKTKVAEAKRKILKRL